MVEEFPQKVSTDSNQVADDAGTPLPYTQAILISIMRGSQPLLFAVILPYIMSMLVSDLSLTDEANVGYLSGMIEMATAVGQAVGVPCFARLSDVYGRRPIMLGGIFTACFASCAFGFARSMSGLLALRIVLGLANAASAACCKVMIFEITEDSNRAKSYDILGIGWQTMGIVAPLLGGLASKPADSLPWLFQGTIWEAYPFALPTVLAAVPSGVAAVVGLFRLEETHPARKGWSWPTRAEASHKAYDLLPLAEELTPDGTKRNENEEALSRKRPSIFSGGLAYMLLLWFALIAMILALETSQLLLFFSSAPLGGLGLSKSGMSTFLAVRPLLICMYEINVFPKISKRFGYEAVFRTLICIPILTTSLYYGVACAALNGQAGSSAFVVLFLGASAILQCITQPVFLCGDILIPSRTPHPSQLSTVNALGEAVAQIAVALGAWYGSGTFAWSAGLPPESWLKGRGVWLAMIALTATVAVLSQRLTPQAGTAARK